jgi:hypothetical protein
MISIIPSDNKYAHFQLKKNISIKICFSCLNVLDLKIPVLKRKGIQDENEDIFNCCGSTCHQLC